MNICNVCNVSSSYTRNVPGNRWQLELSGVALINHGFGKFVVNGGASKFFKYLTTKLQLMVIICNIMLSQYILIINRI